MTVDVRHGDMLAVLPTLPAASFSAVVTDPPYGLKFMGKAWDHGVPGVPFWLEVMRVMKPGAHLLAFGGTRTWHRLAVAIEDAGFELRDTIMWLYGSGFPKAQNTDRAIDKHLGRIGAVIPDGDPVKRMIPGADQDETGSWVKDNGRIYQPGAYVPATPEAEQWKGWASALKPAWEPIIVAQKPFVGSIPANVLRHGCEALNIDASRVTVTDSAYAKNCSGDRGHADNRSRDMEFAMGCGRASDIGRWPANVITDRSDEVLEAFPAEAGAFAPVRGTEPSDAINHVFGARDRVAAQHHGDRGSAARFFQVCPWTPEEQEMRRVFYTGKADAADRLTSKHPTVKPVSLMRYLVKMVTPPGGAVLDPFAGSGTTGMACMAEGFDCTMVEQSAEYVADIRHRIAHVSGQDAPLFAGLG